MQCWNKCGQRAGACEWCGYHRCCKAGADADVCFGSGGANRHECVHVEPPGAAAGASPAATRKALLDADAKAALAAAEQQADAMRAAAAQSDAELHADQSDGKPWWWSAGRLDRGFEGGDLEDDREVSRAVAARSWRRELVMTYANEVGTAWVTNLLLSLREVGIEHTLAVTLRPQHCSALATSTARLSCAWSSWQMRGCADANNPTRTLWFVRHHILPRLLATTRGTVNVLLLDGDVTAQASPYPLLKGDGLRAHNLVYHLDHAARCDAVNIGFAYCQKCAAGGRASWVFDETVRREAAVCDGAAAAAVVDNGSFWAESDGAGITAGPHRRGPNGRPWTTAKDQKIMSDVLGSSCCGKESYARHWPASFTVVDRARFDAKFSMKTCATLKGSRQKRDVRWRELLLPATAAAESVAVAPSGLVDSWHGTGEGELAGWGGGWLTKPPAIAHMVGAQAAGGKLEVMNALGWWRYEVEEVVAHVRMKAEVAMADRAVVGALPPQALQTNCGSDRSNCWTWAQARKQGPAHTYQLRLLGLTGPGATPRHPTAAAFLRADLTARARLAALGALLGRLSARPRVHCDSPWAVRSRDGARGVRQTPAEMWPFAGVGIAIGRCPAGVANASAAGAHPARKGKGQPDPPTPCCSALYGRRLQRRQVDCIAAAHAAFAEGHARRFGSLVVPLKELPRVRRAARSTRPPSTRSSPAATRRCPRWCGFVSRRARSCLPSTRCQSGPTRATTNSSPTRARPTPPSTTPPRPRRRASARPDSSPTTSPPSDGR